MITSKAFSTISYNSKEFLTNKLRELEKAHVIDEWYFIHHKGETDFYTNEREKDHFHVYMNPCKRVDTDSLRDEFKEIDPDNSIPLGCMPFRGSKLDPWIMYAVHDETYLRGIGEVKEFSYSWKDICGYDEEAVKRAVKHASAVAYKELRKRDTVAEIGVVGAFHNGIIKTQEVLSYLAIERARFENIRQQLLHCQDGFADDVAGASPFIEDKETKNE